jgi:hypothetical protein
MTKEDLQKIADGAVAVATKASESCITPARNNPDLITRIAGEIVRAALKYDHRGEPSPVRFAFTGE